MIGSVESINYDGDRISKVTLRFPRRNSSSDSFLEEITACERIGQGSFGTVYRAISSSYPRLALKVSTGKPSRLRQELDVLCKVCTKGKLLLPRFEFGALNRSSDLIVIGMELCVPCTLHDFLLSVRLTNEVDMLFMAHQVIQSVADVHTEGCIHRDVKLQNYVFDLDGNLKLIDFGLSSNTLRPPAGDVVAGTVSFMSPEMAHNALHREKRVCVGAAADVWSLGIVLFSIFTQRNPYPPTSGAATTAAPPSSEPRGDEVCSGSAAPKNINEQLLRRVAAGDWRWPVGCSLSENLKQLVSTILVRDPERRPTVQELLQNKIWNLRRRAPPAVITSFLGVQDDFLLSHDEAHLMRAVEQRSAGLTASLMNSRAPSPTNSSEEEAEHKANAHTTADGHNLDDAASASFKMVAVENTSVDGAPLINVYDMRANARQPHRPLRAISEAITREAIRSQHASRSRSRRGVSRRVATAPSSRAGSAAQYPETLTGTTGEVPLATSASTAAVTAESEAVDEHEQIGAERSREERDDHQQDLQNSRPPASSSLCLLDDEDDFVATGKSSVRTDSARRARSQASGNARALRSVSARSQSAAQRHPSSSVLAGVPRKKNGSVQSTATGTSRAASLAVGSQSGAEQISPMTLARGATGRTASAPQAKHSSLAAKKRDDTTAMPSSSSATEVLSQTPEVVYRHELNALVHSEMQTRAVLSSASLVEHECLLASLRLTIEEDQGRFFIYWLAGEQAASASHPHEFTEMLHVTSERYADGFVCDMCDKEFLPRGRKNKSLHFFHCACERDLCPACYAKYRTKCACTCCHTVHPNQHALREHLDAQHGLTPPKKARKPASISPRKRGRRRSPAKSNQHADVPTSSPQTRRAAKRSPPSAGGGGGGAQRRSGAAASGRSDGDAEHISIAAMRQHAEEDDAAPVATHAGRGGRRRGRTEMAEAQQADGAQLFERPINALPEGPWRPFAKLRRDRQEDAAVLPTPEEREALLHGEWLRHFYLYPNDASAEPFAFVYHAQPGRTGAVFLTNEFPMHSAVFSMLERQFFVVDQVDTVDGNDLTRASTLMKAKSHPELGAAFQSLQSIVAYDTNMMKQRRAPGTVSVYQAPRSAYSCHGDPFLYVRWFRFSENRTLSAFLLSNGAVQVFIGNDCELRWFNEERKFLVRCNGVCEMVDDRTFALAPAINHLLYDTFDA